MANTLAPFFNAQFFDETVTPVSPLAGGHLFTYISGTTTNQLTYQDATTVSPNANPIVLDAAGRCNLWLVPSDVYSLKLTKADGTLIKTFDNVSGTLPSSTGVTSVNGFTGVVVVTADDVGYTAGVVTTWFSGTNVGDALDSIIGHVNSPTAASVSIVDAGNYFAGTNVEDALQNIGASLAAGTSGTYTPGLTGVANVASSTAAQNQWMRLGNVITQSGSVAVTPTAGAATTTQLDITLAVASNFGNISNCGGTGMAIQSGVAPNVGIYAGTATKKARLEFASAGTSSVTITYSFTYLVI